MHPPPPNSRPTAAAAGASAPPDGLRRAVRLVAVLNLGYFGIEFAAAALIGSVSLFADSVDFLEDASVNFLILAALRWPARHRARVGTALAALLLVPGLATLWAAWRKLAGPAAAAPPPPAPLWLCVAGAGALVVNLTCALLLARHRRGTGSLSRAAFLSARNDAVANVAIIGAAFAGAATRSGWPDLLVGLGIAVLNAGAAHEVYAAARDERRAPEP